MLGYVGFSRWWLVVLTSLWSSSSSSSDGVASVASLPSSVAFSTWQGVEPDKWATVWLIKRYVQPHAYFQLVPPNSPLPENTIAFGVPDAAIKRSRRQSMFHQLKELKGLSSPVLEQIDDIIYDLEVNIWDAPRHDRVKWIEAHYRHLQARYLRDQVPIDCYLTFFDRVAALVSGNDHTITVYADRLNLQQHCPGIEAVALPQNQVEQLDHQQLLREISLGKKVVFIDTREQEEFDEVHLPGARLLRLRDVNRETLREFRDADLVVPYCVKDFRGFEVAKIMKQQGISRVATLSPNGLKGWLAAKLPVVNVQVSEQEAQQALLRCAAEPAKCVSQEGS